MNLRQNHPAAGQQRREECSPGRTEQDGKASTPAHGSSVPPGSAFGLDTVRDALDGGRVIEVPAPTGWLVFYVVLSFVLLGCAAALLHEFQTAERPVDLLLTGAGGVLSGLFGLWVLLDYGSRLAFRRLSLRLDPEGIHDHTHGRRPVFVRWRDIEHVFLGVHSRTNRRGVTHVHRYVSIQVSDPAALAQGLGLGARMSLQITQRQTGAPLNVHETHLPHDAWHWVHVVGTLAAERRIRTSTPPAGIG